MKFVGRGTSIQPTNRFEKIDLEPFGDDQLTELAKATSGQKIKTEFFDDRSQSVVSENDSPDLNFNFSVNPYRGCEHGCSYCYARPYHEYLGLSAGLDFETKIFVKRDAPQLLRKWLSRPNWRPEPINFSGITDAYQPIERKLELTRQCLRVAQQFNQPIYIVTKNALVQRDIDILGPMAELNLVRVAISVTTLDADLARKMEPRTSPPAARLAAISALADRGIPVATLLAPVIPGINDVEIPRIIAAVAEAGAQYVSHVILRLPMSVEQIFLDWVQQNLPLRLKKVVNGIKSMRDGQLNQAGFHQRMRGSGVLAQQIHDTFKVFAKKHGVDQRLGPVDCSRFRVPGQSRQGELF